MIKKIMHSINSKRNLEKVLFNKIFVPKKVEQVYLLDDDINKKDMNDASLLHRCLKYDFLESAKWLLSKKADIEIEDTNRQTPIYTVIQNNHDEIFHWMISVGVNINHRDINGRTPLQEAVLLNRTNFIDVLLEKSRNANNTDKYDNTVLHDAILNENKELIKKITSNKSVDKNKTNDKGQSVLFLKDVLKDSSLLFLLIENGVNPKLKDNKGMTFLSYYLLNEIENLKDLSRLIRLGADINSINNEGKSLLVELIDKLLLTHEESKKEILINNIRFLLNENIDLEQENRYEETALFDVIRTKNVELLEVFLRNAILDINKQNIQGETALCQAALMGIKNLRMINLLLQYGADINLKDIKGRSLAEKLIDAILHEQSAKKIDFKIKENGQYLRLFKELLPKLDLNALSSKNRPLFYEVLFYQNNILWELFKSKNVDINKTDSIGRNIIHSFIDCTRKDIDNKTYQGVLKYILALGANVNFKNKDGVTAIQYAIDKKCENTLKTILEATADLKTTDAKGRNLIHSCVFNDKLEHFKLINSMEKKMLNEPDSLGVLPINYAVFLGKKDLVLSMLEAGAHINNKVKRNEKINEYFSKYSYMLDNILDLAQSKTEHRNLTLLVDTMRKEFEFK